MALWLMILSKPSETLAAYILWMISEITRPKSLRPSALATEITRSASVRQMVRLRSTCREHFATTACTGSNLASHHWPQLALKS